MKASGCRPLKPRPWTGWILIDRRPEWSPSQLRDRNLALLIDEVRRLHPEAAAMRRIIFRRRGALLETREEFQLADRPAIPGGWREGLLFFDGACWRGASIETAGTLDLLAQMVTAPLPSSIEIEGRLGAAVTDENTPEARAAGSAAAHLHHARELAGRGSIEGALVNAFAAGKLAGAADQREVRTLALAGAKFGERPGRRPKQTPLDLALRSAGEAYRSAHGRWPSAAAMVLLMGSPQGQEFFKGVASPIADGGGIVLANGKELRLRSLERRILKSRGENSSAL